MNENLKRRIPSSDKDKEIHIEKEEIKESEPKKVLFKEKGKPVRAIANVVTTEYTPVEEELQGKPDH